jgi:hypothetical protein
MICGYQVKKAISLLSMCFLFAGCAGAPKVVSYFVEKGVMQYYLMPVGFNGSKADASIDFTVRAQKDVKNPVICNFTVKTRTDPPKRVERAEFRLIDAEKTLVLHDIEVLFIERAAREIRLTSMMEREDFDALLSSKKVLFDVFCDTGEYSFTPTGDFYGALKQARIEIIDVAP